MRRFDRFVPFALLGLVLCLACVSPEDLPSRVQDLRVLGIRLEPPDLMASPCETREEALLAAVAQFSQDIQLTALIADPKGAGREIRYELFACPDAGNRTCDIPEERVSFAQGVTTAGELTLTVRPGDPFQTLIPAKDNQPLLKAVFDADPYKGLGGVRVPLVLRVQAGDEEIHAQKLMVFSCQLFPDMTPNVTPVLPGMTLNGNVWGTHDVPDLIRGQSYVIEPLDFAALQEPYIVPTFGLEPVSLEERWKISWHTTVGQISPNESGGADLGSQSARHNARWTAPTASDVPMQETQFWFVVRDGRGGTSWLQRKARYRP